MNARENLTVEQALDAATGLLSIDEIERATGLDEKTVRAELKRIAGLGNLDHIPGRGRGMKSRYGLIARLTRTEAAGAGGPAETVQPHPTQAAADQTQAVAPGAADDTARPSDDHLINVIADIRMAIGDNGRTMLDELPSAVRRCIELGDAHRQAVMTWETSMMAAIGEDGVGDVVKAIGALRDARDDLARQFQVLKERHDSYEHAIGEIHRACSDAGIPEGHVATRAHKLAETVATLRQTVHDFAAGEDSVDLLEAASAFLVRAPKRRPRVLTKPEAARTAALAAARATGRAEVMALVPVGTAVRGAEWRDA